MQSNVCSTPILRRRRQQRSHFNARRAHLQWWHCKRHQPSEICRASYLCVFIVTGLLAVACGRQMAQFPETAAAPVSIEALGDANTVCLASLTDDIDGFGDSLRQSAADTSFLVVHGLADTLVADSTGPAWMVLKAEDWAGRQLSWQRHGQDSLTVAVTDGLVRHEYRFVIGDINAVGHGLRIQNSLRPDGVPEVFEWGLKLYRVPCSGMRERLVGPPNPDEPDSRC